MYTLNSGRPISWSMTTGPRREHKLAIHNASQVGHEKKSSVAIVTVLPWRPFEPLELRC